jgi:histidinol phosphatase-like enzyme (inositol monophosphatase family)
MPDLTDADTEELVSVADELADAARAAILPWFRRDGLLADDKGAIEPGAGFDPVTQGDRAGEAAMRAVLLRRRPADSVLGEELGSVAGSSGLTWVLDPIDGTRGFLSGSPTWGVLIGLRDASRALYGIIDQPFIGERFSGGFGRAEVTGPRGRHPLAVRPARDLSQAILFTTFPEVGTPDEGAAFHRLARHCRMVRYGMDCYAYALLAAGQIDLVVEAGLQSYDILGPLAVIEAAGGIVTDWRGGPALDGGRVIAASCPQVHAAALAVLGDVA